MTYATELPTLRLTTLRTLTRHAPPLAVVHVSTPLEDLLPALLDHRVWVVVVDDSGVLCGVLSGDDAVRALKCDPGGWVADHMARSSIMLDAECELDEAWDAVRAENADHVLVVSAKGELLGVLLANLLSTYRNAA
ncbi:MAG: CBS domain-containing protein [Deltaproteobacteria bacterium]|nr:CBS domain-containing protein [Deltaproteobacteria bacterium]